MERSEREQRRDEWVAEQLGVRSVMRDDVDFFDKESEDCPTLAAILPDPDGNQYLTLVDSGVRIAVPDELKLNF